MQSLPECVDCFHSTMVAVTAKQSVLACDRKKATDPKDGNRLLSVASTERRRKSSKGFCGKEAKFFKSRT